MDAAGPPREFEGYRLIRQVGAGGMGRVFLGHDTLLDRPVAVKFISAQDPGAEARSRFLLEARAVARLQHPCVVTVFRAGEFEGQPYIVSEFVEGESLDRMPLPVPWEQVLRIAYDLSRGLTVAHRAGVVHRDIKPGNAILATDGTAKLLDFGIARLMDAPAAEGEPGEAEPDGAAAPLGTVRLAATPRPGLDEDGPATVAVDLPDRLEEEDPPTVRVDLPNRLEAGPATPADAFPGRITLPGRAVGTPAYMAPEVWRGEKASFASDVYSLGALLFSLCAGRPPHEATSIGDLRTLATEHDAPPLASVVSEVSGAFAEVVNRCLQRDPQRRYQDGNEVRAALVPLVAPSPTAPIPEGNPYRGLRAFFFGRDSEIRAILERVSSDPVVVVTGDSGVGKSSVCRAGVLSRVKDWLADGFSWEVATVVPGRHPVQAICRALGNAAGVPGESLAEALADGLPAFGRALRQALGPRRGLVLFVDQLEELVTQSEPAEGSLAATLFGWIRDPVPGFRILATVRGDFLGRLASVRGIGDALSSVLYFLRPLSPERLREAVVGPARLTGIAFESEALVDTLVEGAASSRSRSCGSGGTWPPAASPPPPWKLSAGSSVHSLSMRTRSWPACLRSDGSGPAASCSAW